MRLKGFTLIELMVVIAIIGLLMTIIMVSLGGAKSKSRDSKRQADIRSIKLALASYYADNDMYPKNIYATSGSAPDKGLAPTYLSKVPVDPNAAAACTDSSVSGCYKYVAYGSNDDCNSTSNVPRTYHLGAAMEEKTGGWISQDDDADSVGPYSYAGYSACTTGVTGASAFNGNALACAGTSAMSPTTADGCYDVAP